MTLDGYDAESVGQYQARSQWSSQLQCCLCVSVAAALLSSLCSPGGSSSLSGRLSDKSSCVPVCVCVTAAGTQSLVRLSVYLCVSSSCMCIHVVLLYSRRSG